MARSLVTVGPVHRTLFYANPSKYGPRHQNPIVAPPPPNQPCTGVHATMIPKKMPASCSLPRTPIAPRLLTVRLLSSPGLCKIGHPPRFLSGRIPRKKPLARDRQD